MNDTQPLDPQKQENGFQRKETIYRAYQAIWYSLGIIETFLVFRIPLNLLGANTGSGFT